jgi:creatinine amidohydrolase
MREVLYSIRGPKTMFEMTWEEVAEALKETDMVIQPTGATEQHGPHLPLGMDTIGTVEFCKRLAVKLDSEGIKALVGPPFPFGISSYHMSFPGTISLRNETWQNVVMDILRSLYAHGFRRFVLPLGHGGNWGILQVVGQQFKDEKKDARVLVLRALHIVTSLYPEFFPTGRREKHSGAGETSRILAAQPELVRMERAQAHYSKASDESEGPDHPLMGGGVFVPDRSMKDITPIGSIGDPKLASAEYGEEMFRRGVDWMCEQIKSELGPF